MKPVTFQISKDNQWRCKECGHKDVDHDHEGYCGICTALKRGPCAER